MMGEKASGIECGVLERVKQFIMYSKTQEENVKLGMYEDSVWE